MKRAIKAVELLTRIRLERPDLWKQIVEFSKQVAKQEKLAA